MTGRQLALTPFTTTLWARPSSHFLAQPRAYLSKPRAASFCRSILWETASKALLVEGWADYINSLSLIHQTGH